MLMKDMICPQGEIVKDFLQKKGYGIFDCGGRGTCGKCKAQVLEGNAGELTEIEKKMLTSKELSEQIRLLCQIQAVTDVKLSIKCIEKKEEGISFSAKMPVMDNQKQEKKQKEISVAESFGVAFDIGTTTVVGRLFDLTTKQMIKEMTAWNPQQCFGADVITRMQYCLKSNGKFNGRKEMQRQIADCLDKMLQFFMEVESRTDNQKEKERKVEKELEIKKESELEKEIRINKIVVAGNSAMTHFFLEQNIDSLAKAPFCPLFTKGQERKGRECHLKNAENAAVFTLPLLEGQIGGDITAGLLSIDIFSKPDNTMFVDIGTNGEIAFFRNAKIYLCSTAAGPALEGVGISCGMRASLGAIERVWLSGGEVYTKVIGNTMAQGICGSALIDAIAVFLDLGKIEKSGYLDSGSIILTKPERGDFNISITQEDIRQYQMVKGAIRAGMEVLMNTANAKLKEIEHIYIAGSFGSNIRKQNAIKTGLLPNISSEKITMIGNASLQGASMVLLSEKSKQYAETIREKIVFVNLAEKKEFQELYIKYLDF